MMGHRHATILHQKQPTEYAAKLMRSSDLTSRPRPEPASSSNQHGEAGLSGGVAAQVPPQPRLKDKLHALFEAQVSVRNEVLRLSREQALDRMALRCLGEVAHEFADQADTLLLTLTTQDAPGHLITAVEEIFDAFRDAERQIEDVTRRGRR